MQFASVSFILFAAVTLALYYAVPRRMQWWVLLAASYFFYFCAGWKYLLFIGYTTLITYATARWMQRRADASEAFVAENRDRLEKAERKLYRAREKKKRFWILTLGLVLGFGVLAVLKYTAFVLGGVNGLIGSLGGSGVRVPSLLLPLGISFYTFQSMGYLIDVYRQKVRAESNLCRLALFVSYFPQLIQGPISRFGALSEQLFSEHRFDGLGFRAGLVRVVWGFFKKLVIADTVMIAVKALVVGEYRGAYVVLLILLYSIQIYGDFTGGIDITIGLSEMMGIQLAENFDRPFSSRSTKEYWRRWHMTMGSWFSDYVFYPLSVSNTMQRLSKWSRAHLGAGLGKRIPVYTATIVTWFLTGLWHGAGLNFIVWGLLNCLVILVSQELQPLYLRFGNACPRLVASKAWAKWQMVRTFLLMGLIRSLDCYRNVPLTFRLWGSIVTTWNLGDVLQNGLLRMGLSVFDVVVILCGVLLMWAVSRMGIHTPVRRQLAKRPVLMCLCLCLLVTAILLLGAYGIGYDASDFIYDQF